ncbi:hypothetical protein [Acinetobacter nosocomialis]|uniref:hypothetical protein n=1 Tax=Acinetobacter nosocomialis TaxID=106654 RepID=UPI001A9A979A|nr:hypothetical protein [Acinetobacter nosocomialis]MBO1279888.1 hypothetical protein [Acinetobacter nosocomialis]
MKNKTQWSNRLFLILCFIFSLVGCVSFGPNSTYYMSTTSFQYFNSYHVYMTEINGEEIGGGFGGGMNTSPVKIGSQVITWGEANSKKKHVAKNQVILTREQLKGKKYLAVHIYPDETVEITISNNWPMPTEKGLSLLDQLRR